MHRESRLTQRKDPADVLDYKEKVTKIYFVRHGETKANKLRLLFGQTNWDLTQKGRKQAARAAGMLSEIVKKENINLIISSPLKRAKSTAKIVAKKTKIKKIILDKDLTEKSEGNWEVKTFWQVRKQDPKNYYKWIKEPFKNRPPNGESIADLNKRVKRFYRTILNKYLGKNIIVVCHSGPIRLFILNLLGADIHKFWYLKEECGSITEIHVSKKHSMIWAVNKN